MDVNLRVETRTFVRFFVSIAIFAAVIFSVIKLQSILVILIISAFLAIALNPPVNRLASLLPKHSRVLSAALAYILTLSVLGLLVYVAAPPIVRQTNDFVNNFPHYIEQLSTKQNSFSGIIDQYQLQDEIDQFIDKVRNESGAIAENFGTQVVSGVNSVFNGTITLLTILVLTFLMLIEGPAWMQRIWSLYTDKKRLHRDQRLVRKMYKVVTGYVNGQVVVAAINASCVLVILFVLSQIFQEVPLSAILPLTGVIFVSALIPMFGAVLGAVIVSLVLVFNSIPAALIFLAYYIIYQQIENNVVQPLIQARTVQLTALGVFTSAVIGVALLGIVGAVLAIPVAGCIRVLLIDYIKNRNDYTMRPDSKPEPAITEPSVLDIGAKTSNKHSK